ncbi:MAG TPA: UDP-N-acetylmuramoyl-L-alanyl-D-glutamate--2,6-diaminopimelate ligase [Candidatus Angelobacter sp.]|jgi:UDP-N-acetylmuramoyl-L-alanyl-D-glutamate--2,6-diaminopimelate ligase|nr:UDP-N-acetylmuramoyl-L-alanyl-D-glutamate--2,6-diaminopimelate ligase [Candidatus Angelobacter sp.]
MNFSELLRGLGVPGSGGDPEILGVDYDSRRVRPGWLFVAMRGEATDGNRYIEAALKNGAVAVVTDSSQEPARNGIAWAIVPHGRKALAELSSAFYGRPAERLKILGVTGTNGKTTTTFLTEAILNHCGKKSALVGTIEYHVPDKREPQGRKVLPAPHTTPESLELNQLFAQALASGASDAVMEVSSHALEQGRVWGIPYEVAVFTNLTRDHLDYHRDMESYFAAKRMLFDGTGTCPPRAAVINADDPFGRILVNHHKSEQVIRYGLAPEADFRAQGISLRPTETSFELSSPSGTVPIISRLIGKVNVYNLLAASAAAWSRGCALDQIREAVAKFNQVPGRFERVDSGQPFTVVVDYAHTDDALRNLTSIAREFASRAGAGGRVITLFGCGGDRDRTKRPLMAQAAAEGSDLVVVTSDNPRSEDPQKIIHEILPGFDGNTARKLVEPDRRKAIRLALEEARDNDVVLVAGKGHEKVQITRDGTFPFDDVQVAREALEQMGYTKPDGGRK